MMQERTLHEDAAVRVMTCLGVDLEMPHLRHFLNHYIGLGVNPANIHLIANTQDAASPGLAQTAEILAEFGAPAPYLWIEQYTSDGMWQQRRDLQRRHAQPGDWIINADIDEHHQYPTALSAIIQYCEMKGYNCVQGFLVDRLAHEGELAQLNEEPPLAQQYPLEAEVHLALVGRGEHHGIDGTTKLMLHRWDVLPSRGGHNPWAKGAEPRYLAGLRLATHPRATDPEFRFAFPFRVDHYKWTATRQRTFERRIAAPGVSAAGREVGGKMISYLSKHGRIRPQDVSVKSAQMSKSWLGWKALSLRMRLGARLRAKFAHFLSR